MNETTTNLSARDDALDALTLLLRRAETAGEERRLMQRDILTQVHLLGIEGAAAYYFPESCGDMDEAPFDRGKNGELLRTIRNFRLLLEMLAPFQTLRKNVFSGRIEWNGSPLCDEDESRMLDFLETHYALKSERDLQHAVRLVAAKRAYHPVREKLASLPWDGKAHILPFLIRVMKAAPTAYSGECARLIFHCGVARIMQPGCKVDDVVILQGKQGDLHPVFFIDKVFQVFGPEKAGIVQRCLGALHALVPVIQDMVVGQGGRVYSAAGQDFNERRVATESMGLFPFIPAFVTQDAFQVYHRQVVLHEHFPEIGKEPVIAFFLRVGVKGFGAVSSLIFAAQRHIPRKGQGNRLLRGGVSGDQKDSRCREGQAEGSEQFPAHNMAQSSPRYSKRLHQVYLLMALGQAP